MSIVTGIDTETLKQLSEEYLRRLDAGECGKIDQPLAALVIGERIRLLENAVDALSRPVRPA